MNKRVGDLEHLEQLRHVMIETAKENNYNFCDTRLLNISRQIDSLISEMQQSNINKHNKLKKQLPHLNPF